MIKINLLKPKYSGKIEPAFTVHYPKCIYCGEYAGILTVREHDICIMALCYKCMVVAIKKVMGEPIYNPDDVDGSNKKP
jgi:hypothetical protein